MRGVFYHPKVPNEVREILAYYDEISEALGNAFWNELKEAIEHARKFPERHHFDSSGRRRSNLKRFPYHVLFRVFNTYIRVTVVRHHRRNPNFGAKRK
jgi:plasmid stabilization system protein ParE